MSPRPYGPVQARLDRGSRWDEERFGVGCHHGEKCSGPFLQPGLAGTAVRGRHGRRETVKDQPEGLVLDTGHRGAMTRSDPRVGTTEPVPWDERPFQVDVASEDVDPLGEFGPGESTGGTNVERSGDASDAGGGGVNGLDDVGVVEVLAADPVVRGRGQGEAAAAFRVEQARQHGG